MEKRRKKIKIKNTILVTICAICTVNMLIGAMLVETRPLFGLLYFLPFALYNLLFFAVNGEWIYCHWCD